MGKKKKARVWQRELVKRAEDYRKKHGSGRSFLSHVMRNYQDQSIAPMSETPIKTMKGLAKAFAKTRDRVLKHKRARWVNRLASNTKKGGTPFRDFFTQ